ncbi:unnamed protein product [Caenorhabditis angaria]|uniref:Uncharacterized protein n=1 Tax=Caenorhabditis angaria TaxID=860376 RepID=A0A9P1I4H2_9PELO|nr:unnamed protein product [Caenorhabditis angaria]
MKSNQFGEPGNDDFTVELSIKFTENYPEGIPETTIDGIDEKFEGATLNLSDMTLIGAQDEVEIDESLFGKEMPTQSPPFSTGPCNILVILTLCCFFCQ